METYFYGLIAMIMLALIIWLVSIKAKDVSIVDSFWSVFFLLASIVFLWSNESVSLQKIILFALVTIWAIRLSLFITWRNHGKPEDSRYQDIRSRYSPNFAIKSLFIIFIFQALLAGLIVIPLWFVFTRQAEFGLLDIVGIALWLIGMLFEVIGDMQMARFRKTAASQNGEIMDQGLWQYTRHPNYFGESCIWWGYYFFALSAGGWWTIFAPVVMTWLLLKFSGVALLESQIVHRRPAYRDYIKRTSAFIPWLPADNVKTVAEEKTL